MTSLSRAFDEHEEEPPPFLIPPPPIPFPASSDLPMPEQCRPKMLSDNDMLHLSSYLIVGCIILLIIFSTAACSLRCCSRRSQDCQEDELLVDNVDTMDGGDGDKRPHIRSPRDSQHLRRSESLKDRLRRFSHRLAELGCHSSTSLANFIWLTVTASHNAAGIDLSHESSSTPDVNQDTLIVMLNSTAVNRHDHDDGSSLDDEATDQVQVSLIPSVSGHVDALNAAIYDI